MRHLTLLTALLLAPLAALHAAELRLPSILSDHMVLQCDQPVPVWGWGDVGEKVMKGVRCFLLRVSSGYASLGSCRGNCVSSMKALSIM